MALVTEPETLDCAMCGDAIESGYLPATETDDGDDPLPDDAVCDTCGFTEVGMHGCAPELGDVTDAEADVLLHVRVTDGSVEVLGRK
jgi:hypothetical protein